MVIDWPTTAFAEEHCALLMKTSVVGDEPAMVIAMEVTLLLSFDSATE